MPPYKTGFLHWLSVAALTAAWATTSPLGAYPVSASFTLDPAQSSLAVQASAFIGSDSDVKPLAGSVDALFDFGASGAFPPSALVTVSDANITPTGAYNLDLGFPPLLGVRITASNLRATVATPAPPGTMTKTPAPGGVYRFDASQFLLTVDAGSIAVSGVVNQTIDLAQTPASGSPAPGTFGTVSFVAGGTVGPYTRIDAELDIPIQIVDVVEAGGVSVDVTLTAHIRGDASFYVALAGVPGDFDQDGDVDATDLPILKANFGLASGATASTGDADGDADADGHDFLAWQSRFATLPPPAAARAVVAVPEPTSVLAAIVCLLPMASRRLRGLAA
ncbi:MAG: hypothetical protein DCC67_03310 [Planctomycetota bacterium]|nr:MAG: hypothetical protein DCC67_03310 [Planctomycetota bacterium]